MMSHSRLLWVRVADNVHSFHICSSPQYQCKFFGHHNITKITVTTAKPAESLAYLIKYAEFEEVYCPDPGLRDDVGVRWSRLPSGQEIHFVPPWGNGVDTWHRHAKEMSDHDKDCTEWTPWLINHPAWTVADLSPIVKKLLADGMPFFGPVLRGDNVYQLYMKVPHCTYMEIDSAKYDESLKAPTTWKKQAARYNTTPPPK
eukprot:m.112888 g.112888  ORF g.112888 m.112888 type:complete len:201 (-) comp17049_c0_seq3:560-1162(-)